MRALDDFVTRARSQNSQHHDSHAQSLRNLSGTVKSSYSNSSSHFNSTYQRVRDLGDEMTSKTASLQESLAPLDCVLRQPLSKLRENITSTQIQEYQPTGETPQKVQYTYPTELPRTDAHDTLLAALRRPMSSSSDHGRSPSKSTTSMIPVIFNDAPSTQIRDFSASLPASSSRPGDGEHQRPTTSGGTGLREIDVNVNVHNISNGGNEEQVNQIPSFKRSVSGKLPVLKSGKKNAVVPAEGRENTNLLSQSSTGRRRSPRNG